jgi:hypothetical protein
LHPLKQFFFSGASFGRMRRLAPNALDRTNLIGVFHHFVLVLLLSMRGVFGIEILQNWL